MVEAGEGEGEGEGEGGGGEGGNMRVGGVILHILRGLSHNLYVFTGGQCPCKQKI